MHRTTSLFFNYKQTINIMSNLIISSSLNPKSRSRLLALIAFNNTFSPSLLAFVRTDAFSKAIPPPETMPSFIAAFVAGLLACKWMISLVKKSKLSYFSLYCAIVGIAATSYTLLH